MRKPHLSLIILFSLWITLSLFSTQSVTYANPDLIKEKALELRVMSFNIRFGIADDGQNSWINRREMVFDVIRDFHPDVVGLQEDFGFQIKEIRQALPNYGEVAIYSARGNGTGIHNAILYRIDRFDVEEKGNFWFSDTPEVPGSKHWGNRRPIICTWARLMEKDLGQAFYIYNTHLDRESLSSRRKSVVLLAYRITQRKNPNPFVVTGDLNAWENSTAIMYLKGKASLPGLYGDEPENPVPMVDSFRVLHREAVEVGTYNGFRGIRNSPKVDYIMVQPDVQVLEAGIIRTNREGRYPSDHYPITALVLLPTFSKHLKN